MKYVFSLAAAICLVTSPTALADPLMGPNTIDNPNVDVALGYIERVWVRHDPVAGFEEFVSPESVHFPGMPGDSNPEGLAKFLKGFPAFKYDVKQVFADGDYVIVHSYLTGVPKTGELVSSPMPGAVPKPKLADEVVDIYKIVDGKIVLHWDVVEPVVHEATELFDPPSQRNR